MDSPLIPLNAAQTISTNPTFINWFNHRICAQNQSRTTRGLRPLTAEEEATSKNQYIQLICKAFVEKHTPSLLLQNRPADVIDLTKEGLDIESIARQINAKFGNRFPHPPAPDSPKPTDVSFETEENIEEKFDISATAPLPDPKYTPIREQLSISPELFSLLLKRDASEINKISPKQLEEDFKQMTRFSSRSFGTPLQVCYLESGPEKKPEFLKQLFQSTVFKNDLNLWKKLFFFVYFINDWETFTFLSKKFGLNTDLQDCLLYLPKHEMLQINDHAKHSELKTEYISSKCLPLFAAERTEAYQRAIHNISSNPKEYLNNQKPIPLILDLSRNQLYFAQFMVSILKKDRDMIRDLISMNDLFQDLREGGLNSLLRIALYVELADSQTDFLTWLFNKVEAPSRTLMTGILLSSKETAKCLFRSAEKSDLSGLFVSPYVDPQNHFTPLRGAVMDKIRKFAIPFQWTHKKNIELAIRYRDAELLALLFSKGVNPNGKMGGDLFYLELLKPQDPESLDSKEKAIADLFKRQTYFNPSAELLGKIEMNSQALADYLRQPIEIKPLKKRKSAYEDQRPPLA